MTRAIFKQSQYFQCKLTVGITDCDGLQPRTFNIVHCRQHNEKLNYCKKNLFFLLHTIIFEVCPYSQDFLFQFKSSCTPTHVYFVITRQSLKSNSKNV